MFFKELKLLWDQYVSNCFGEKKIKFHNSCVIHEIENVEKYMSYICCRYTTLVFPHECHFGACSIWETNIFMSIFWCAYTYYVYLYRYF